MKYLYIVDHAISFPCSEYGGLWNVIAENNDECFDLISNHWNIKDMKNITQNYEKTF